MSDAAISRMAGAATLGGVIGTTFYPGIGTVVGAVLGGVLGVLAVRILKRKEE